jgi:FkbM family methyltransferase
MLISIEELLTFNIKVSGILHIGAHECEELKAYNSVLDIKNENIFWIEAMPIKVEICKNKYKDILIYQAVIDDEDNKDIVFNITNNGQSSSILELGTHKIHHPCVNVIQKIKTKTIRLDTLIDKYSIPIHNLNFINIDIQGVELRALKSMEKYLCHIQYIYTEVNTEYVYKDCNLIEEIDNYLKQYGFTRVIVKMWNNCGWGDAFYIKK